MTTNGTNGTGLSTKQNKAIRALLTEKTMAAVAEKADVAERTVYRWLSDDDAFKRALGEAETAAIGATVRRLVSLQFKALQAIEEALDDCDAGHWVKLRAASIVLDTMLRLREQHTLEERLAELEKRYHESN